MQRPAAEPQSVAALATTERPRKGQTQQKTEVREGGAVRESGAVRTCGHGEPRRICDVCLDARDGRGPWASCSRACLDEHRAEAHADAGSAGAAAARERAAGYQARVNANVAGDRALFAPHRARVTALIEGAGRGGSLCVLGAGNGSDLDVPKLAKTFSEIHLVDLDGDALARGRAALPARLRERVILHPDVDLTGLIDHLDDWGDAFPAEAELGRAAVPAIQGVLTSLVTRAGRRFDTVVSTCVLSQLAVPFHRAWLLPATAWANLHAALTAIHLSTLSGATEPGGTGILIFDVLSSKNAPALRKLAPSEPESIEAFTEAQLASGKTLDPDPSSLLRQLQSPGMERIVEGPRLTPPWPWNIGTETQLVYGLVFRRP